MCCNLAGREAQADVVPQTGTILTAYHVVQGASNIAAKLPSGASYSATVEKYDETYADGGSDLALLRISASGLPTVSLGDSDTIKIGNFVIVMGYPLGLGFNVTTGIISSIADAGGGRTVFVIDAAVNPGNSGGPLLNGEGKVIGIVFGKADVPLIMIEGMNFTTPINTAKSKLGLGIPTPEPPAGRAPAGMALIPAGGFQMGNSFNEGSSDERPVRTVIVSAFYMDQFEVTKALWGEVASWAAAHGYDIEPFDGSGKAPSHPVNKVSWYKAVKWANARSEKEGLTPCYYTDSSQTTIYRTGNVDVPIGGVKWTSCGYRLPTEAEWEKAARGGCEGRRFPWCDTNTIQHSRANYDSCRGEAFAANASPLQGTKPGSLGAIVQNFKSVSTRKINQAQLLRARHPQ